MLKLTRPLVVFDLETTGTDVKNDRITQIAGIRIEPKRGNFAEDTSIEKKFNWLCNPTVNIPAEVTTLTGITNEGVRNLPKFYEVADDVLAEFEGADIGGFAVEDFDLPLLQNELARCNRRPIDLEGVRIVDAQQIYHAKEERRLVNAYALYCGKGVGKDEAHRADFDAAITLDILKAIPEHYGIDATLESLQAAAVDKSGRFVDRKRKFIWRDGQAAFNFGKHKGRSLRDILAIDRSYINWLVTSADDFGGEARRILIDGMNGIHRTRPSAETANA